VAHWRRERRNRLVGYCEDCWMAMRLRLLIEINEELKKREAL